MTKGGFGHGAIAITQKSMIWAAGPTDDIAYHNTVLPLATARAADSALAVDYARSVSASIVNKLTFRLKRIADAKCMLTPSSLCLSVCLSMSLDRRMHTLLHGPGCMLGNAIGGDF